MKRIPQCQRRVNNIRCTTMGADFCKIHSPIMCSECEDRSAVYECTTCSTPICPTCQHHDSFGQ